MISRPGKKGFKSGALHVFLKICSFFLVRTGDHQRILEERQTAEEARWETLSRTDKIRDWAERHQYSLIMGGWATSLGVAGAIISRDR